MQNLNLFSIYLDKINGLKSPYFVTGSVASTVYGEPRLTYDIDIVIHLKDSDIPEFLNSFPASEFDIPPIEIIRNECKRSTRGHFNLIHNDTGFKADIYPEGKDSLHIWVMKNRKEYKFNSTTIFVAPPEYVIIRKLQYYEEGKSDKHLQDIRNIILNCPVQIDYKFIQEHVGTKESREVFNDLANNPEK